MNHRAAKKLREEEFRERRDARLCARVEVFLAKAAEEKDDPVLAAAAEWVERGDWKAEGAKDA